MSCKLLVRVSEYTRAYITFVTENISFWLFSVKFLFSFLINVISLKTVKVVFFVNSGVKVYKSESECKSS